MYESSALPLGSAAGSSLDFRQKAEVSQRLGIPSPGCRTRSKSPRHGTSRDGEWECDCADLLLVQLPEFKEALAWGVLFHLFPDYAGTCHLLRSVADTYAAPSLNGGVRASRAHWHLGLVLRPNQ